MSSRHGVVTARLALGTLAMIIAGANPEALPAQGVPDAWEIEQAARAFIGRLRVGDIQGAMAFVDVRPLQRALQAMRDAPGVGGLPGTVVSLEDRQRLEPDAPVDELQLAVRLDSMRHARAARLRTLSLIGMRISRDSLDLSSVGALFRRALEDARASRATTGACSPGMVGVSPSATTVQLLGAVRLDDSTGYLVVHGGEGSLSTLPDYRERPVYLVARRDANGWRIAWSPELHIRVASQVRWVCIQVGASGDPTAESRDAGRAPDDVTEREDAVARAAATDVVREYFSRFERMDWSGAVALLELGTLQAARDEEIAAKSRREAIASPSLPTVEGLMRRDPSLSFEMASAEVRQSRLRRRQASALSPPFLASRSSGEVRAMSLAEVGELMLQGLDPRVRHTALNAAGLCVPPALAQPGRWLPPRVLGAVPVHDSVYFVAYRDDPAVARPAPPALHGLDRDDVPSLRTMVAVRTSDGWRVRFDPLDGLVHLSGGWCERQPR